MSKNNVNGAEGALEKLAEPTAEQSAPIHFLIGNADGLVYVDFGRSVQVLGMQPVQAKKLGQTLIKRANDLLNDKFR